MPKHTDVYRIQAPRSCVFYYSLKYHTLVSVSDKCLSISL